MVHEASRFSVSDNDFMRIFQSGVTLAGVFVLVASDESVQ